MYASTLKLPGTGQSLGSGIAWTNPTRITAADGLFATVNVGSGQQSRLLVGTNFGFALSAPSTAIFAGARLIIGNSKCTNLSHIVNVGFYRGGVLSSSDPFIDLTSVGTDYSLGGPRCYFGFNPTARTSLPTLTQVNSSAFGFYIQVGGDDLPSTASIDFFKMQIFFALPQQIIDGDYYQ